MTKRQLFIAYFIVIFMMVWGFGLINAIKFHEPILMSDVFNVFVLSQVIYTATTLWLTGWMLNRLLRERRYLQVVVGFIAVIIFFVLIRYFLEEIAMPALTNTRNYNPNTSIRYYFLDNVYYALVYVALGFGIYLLDQQVSNQKKQALLQQQNREAELQFLRSQINPHFLFNTLNNIYSLVYEQSPKAPAAMLQLSELMRYILYEKKDTVELSREWDYIKSFITLQQLRFDYPLPMEITTDHEPGKQQIPPYLLIPFIENAFKHGDFKDPNVPLRIRLTMISNGIAFEISNKIGTQQKDKTGGVGLDNVRRRLNLLYPGRYELTTTSSNGIFTADLRLMQ